MDKESVHIVTYATHEEGMFTELKDDAARYGVDIEVLGFGKEWAGFFGKLLVVRNYLDTLRGDDLVVVMDGFDTRIVKSLDGILETWHSFDANIVFAVNSRVPLVPHFLSDYIYRRSMLNADLNAGLYMGKVQSLRTLIDMVLPLKEECRGDDQRAFCHVFNHMADELKLKLDYEKRLFYCVEQNDRESPLEYEAPFLHFPGNLTFARWVRAPAEYFHWFIPEIVVLLLLIAAAIYAMLRVSL
jgi:hypothetical protein